MARRKSGCILEFGEEDPPPGKVSRQIIEKGSADLFFRSAGFPCPSGTSRGPKQPVRATPALFENKSFVFNEGLRAHSKQSQPLWMTAFKCFSAASNPHFSPRMDGVCRKGGASQAAEKPYNAVILSPFAVILSAAKNLALPAPGKLREGSRSEYFQDNARFFVAAAPQNDSAFEFFRTPFSPAEIAAFNLNPSRMGATQKLASQVLPEMSDSALRRVTSGQRAKRVARRATP